MASLTDGNKIVKIRKAFPYHKGGWPINICFQTDIPNTDKQPQVLRQLFQDRY